MKKKKKCFFFSSKWKLSGDKLRWQFHEEIIRFYLFIHFFFSFLFILCRNVVVIVNCISHLSISCIRLICWFYVSSKITNNKNQQWCASDLVGSLAVQCACVRRIEIDKPSEMCRHTMKYHRTDDNTGTAAAVAASTQLSVYGWRSRRRLIEDEDDDSTPVEWTQKKNLRL